MKEITVKDCLEMKERFEKFAATNHNIVIDMTLKKVGLTDFNKIVKDQKEARSMFRCILTCMGESSEDYKEV